MWAFKSCKNVKWIKKNKKKQTVELTSVFHLSLTNRKTSYSSSSSFSESHGVLRTGIITMSFSTAITKFLPMRQTRMLRFSHCTDDRQTRLTTIQVQPWVMEGRSIKWFKHFIETWLPRHSILWLVQRAAANILCKLEMKGAHFILTFVACKV